MLPNDAKAVLAIRRGEWAAVRVFFLEIAAHRVPSRSRGEAKRRYRVAPIVLLTVNACPNALVRHLPISSATAGEK
jgi:hypothetical protein